MRKTILATIFCLVLSSYSASADDRAISANKLPATAQSFLNTYYKGNDIIVATQDWGVFGSDYSVVLADGTKVEVGNNGECIAAPQTFPPALSRRRLSTM